MKHKIFTLLFAIMASVGMMRAEGIQVGEIWYYFDESQLTATVTSSTETYGYLGAIDIPEKVRYNNNYYTVISIDYQAFNNCIYLTSVTIPNSVTYIGNYAFSGCKNLTSVTIPNSVTYIGSSAFQECSVLTSVTIPNSLKRIESKTFYACGLTSIEIPNSVTSIGSEAFRGCTGLTSIEIPNSVTSIESEAFRGCTSLTSIEIPSSVANIGREAFKECTSLTSIDIPNSVTSIGDMAFEHCTSLTSAIIGNSVTSIGVHAFSGCTSLTSIEIPNSVTSIGADAFYGCTSLTSIEIPNSVTSIGEYAFKECTSLTSIEIPNGVTSIEERTFQGCTSLTSVTIPNSLASIEYLAFYDCKGLKEVHISDLEAWCKITFSSNPLEYAHHLYLDDTEITDLVIPTGIKMVKDNTFSGGSGFASITIPSSVVAIGGGAFSNCTKIITLDVPNTVLAIGDNAFNNILNVHYTGSATGSPWGARYINAYEEDGLLYSDASKTKVIKCNYDMTSVVIPNSVTSIENDAFRNCNNLTSVVIGNGVTNIERLTFAHCSSLTSIILGNSVTSIGGNAFYGCTGLTTIEIPNSVTSIGSYAFYNCENLTSVTIGNSVTNIEGKAFDGCSNLQEVHISDLAAWCSISFAEYYSNPLACAHHLYLDDTEITDLVIPETVTVIGKYAFVSCWELKSLDLPNSVTKIDEDAFSNCGFESLIIGENVRSIEYGAFSYCNSLKTLEIGSNVGSIKNRAFIGCFLNKVICKATYPPTCNSDCGIPNTDCFLFVPESSVQTYSNKSWWKDFKAIYAIGSAFTVTFVDDEGKMLSMQVVEKGGCAEDPGCSDSYEAEFIGWDKDLCNVTEDMVVTALYHYTRHNYTVRLYAPEACEEGMKPMSNINGYVFDEEEEHGRTVYTHVLEYTLEGEILSFCDAVAEANYNQWYSIQHYEDGEWRRAEYELPVVIVEDTTITLDYSDNEQYRYENCNPYMPKNIQAVPNGDGTYTISWDPITGDAYDHMNFSITAFGRAFRSENHTETTVVTPFLPWATQYGFYLYIRDADNNWLGGADYYFTVDPVEEHSITTRVLIQPSSGYDTSNGVKLYIAEKQHETNSAVDATDEGEGWYSYTHTTTDPGLLVTLNENSYWNYVTISKDTCLEYLTDLHYVDCDAHVAEENYRPYNLHAESGAGEVTLSWDVVDEPYEYNVVIYQIEEEGSRYRYRTQWCNGSARETTFVIGNSEEMTFTWSILPYDADGFVLSNEVYGETFTVAPSSYTPTNLNATPNGDGTYTITWDAPVGDTFNYEVRVLRPGWSISPTGFIYSAYGISEGWITEGTSFVTKVLPFAGSYAFMVYTYSKDKTYPDASSYLGLAWAQFTIDQVERHDITIRVLVRPDGGYDTSNGVWFGSYNCESDQIDTVMANDEGKGWYNYTYTTTSPGVSFGLCQYGEKYIITEEFSVLNSICFEYTHGLYYVDCDAHLLDYTPFNLHAEPGAGTVTLSWDVLDAAYRYYVTLYHNGEEWTSTSCTEPNRSVTITLANDSAMTFTWSVQSASYVPESMISDLVYGEEFTVEPSPYHPKNLQVTPNGDDSYTISWDPVDLEGVMYGIIVLDPEWYDVGQAWGFYETSFVTNVLTVEGIYHYILYVYDANWRELSRTNATFEHQSSLSGIDIVTGNPSSVTHKILRNGQILILRGDKVYTVTGQEAK